MINNQIFETNEALIRTSRELLKRSGKLQAEFKKKRVQQELAKKKK